MCANPATCQTTSSIFGQQARIAPEPRLVRGVELHGLLTVLSATLVRQGLILNVAGGDPVTEILRYYPPRVFPFIGGSPNCLDIQNPDRSGAGTIARVGMVDLLCSDKDLIALWAV